MNPEDNNEGYGQQYDNQSQENYRQTNYDSQNCNSNYDSQNCDSNYGGHNYDSRYGRKPQPISNMSIAALILGCLAILTSCCGIGGIIFGTLGIIIAMMSKGQEPMQTNTKIGLGLSITGLVIGLIFGIFMIAGLFLYTSEETYQEYDYYEGQPYDNSEYSDDYQQMPYQDNLNRLMEQYESQEL